MTQVSYPYQRRGSRRYGFISNGKKRIEKVVDFIPLKTRHRFNLGFGDLSPDGTIDDKVNSNNGDIVKVLATVVAILRNFTEQNPQAEIYFEGSTVERTVLYGRILKTYYTTFSKEFSIACILNDGNDFQMVPFDSSSDQKYLAFLIKRIS